MFNRGKTTNFQTILKTTGMTGLMKKMINKENKCDREGTSCQTIQKTTGLGCSKHWLIVSIG